MYFLSLKMMTEELSKHFFFLNQNRCIIHNSYYYIIIITIIEQLCNSSDNNSLDDRLLTKRLIGVHNFAPFKPWPYTMADLFTTIHKCFSFVQGSILGISYNIEVR